MLEFTMEKALRKWELWFGLVLWHINHCRLFHNKSSLYKYIEYIYVLVWLILWHIEHCRLFNAKSSLYIFIRYIWFGLVRFYGISTIEGYLIPSSFFIFKHFYFKPFSLVWLHSLYAKTQFYFKQFSLAQVHTQFKCRKQFHFKLISLA